MLLIGDEVEPGHLTLATHSFLLDPPPTAKIRNALPALLACREKFIAISD